MKIYLNQMAKEVVMSPAAQVKYETDLTRPSGQVEITFYPPGTELKPRESSVELIEVRENEN
jgi:hypothetical protein